MDFWNLFEHPTFMFIFHEVVCILGILYYLPAMMTRIREEKEGKKYTVGWKDLKNIVQKCLSNLHQFNMKMMI